MIANIEAEQQLLGAILTDNAIYHLVSEVLTGEHFADPVHRRIFEICATRINAEKLASPVTLKTLMDGDEGLKALGGIAYLGRLAVSAVAMRAAKDYAATIIDAWQRRTVMDAMQKAQEAISGGGEVSEAIGVVEAVTQALSVSDGQSSTVSYAKALSQAIEDAVSAHRGDRIGISLNIPELDKLLGPIRAGDFLVLGGAPSMGKAQPLTSMVLTEGGWKAMSEVRAGERLASVDGAESIVTGVFPQGPKPIYRVHFSDGRSVRCCGEHLWEVGGAFFKRGRRVIDTETLAQKLTCSHGKGRINVPLFFGNYGSDAPLRIDPWLLGVFVGNGHYPEAGSPMFSTADASTLWKFAGCLHEDDEVVAASGYDYRVRGRGLGGSRFGADLAALGLRGCKAETKFIPAEYMTARRADRAALLRGLLDTDGWVEKFGAVRFSTSSPVLADQVCDLVRSLGGVCSVSRKVPKFHHNGEARIGQDHFVLNIRHDDASEFFSVIHKKRRCGRKKPVTLTVTRVEPDGFENAQCIAVSHPRRLYVTDGFVMTHNTSLALSIANRAADKGIGVAIASLEMTGQSLGFRALAEAANVPYASMLRGTVEDDDFRKVIEGVPAIMQRPIEIIQPHVKDLHALFAAFRRIQIEMNRAKTPLGLIVIDYLQLVRAPGKDRFQIVANVSQGLKAMAMQLGVPLIALSQLSRDVQGREDKRPRLTDLRESGQIEQDADFVLFTHREYYYLKREGAPKGKDGKVKDEARADYEALLKQHEKVMEVICAKQRMGTIGSRQIGFDETTNRIWSLHRQDVEDF